MKIRSFTLWNTSCLAGIGHRPIRQKINDTISRSSGQNIISGLTVENCGTGIMISERHRCPTLSTEIFNKISNDEPEFVTRHIESCFLETAQKGYFRIGTLMSYRAKENQISGRLGDHQESRQKETFNSRTSYFESLQAGNVDISDASFKNTDNHIVVETIVNDFCSCSSIGEFNADRGQKLRDAETDLDKKPGAFITYHLATLKAALKARILRDFPHLSTLEALGRKVEYGQKDRKWDVEQNFKYSNDGDAIAVWLGIAFVKSPSFSHEEEYRLLLVDSAKAGGLNSDIEPIVIEEDNGIVSAIRKSGFY